MMEMMISVIRHELDVFRHCVNIREYLYISTLPRWRTLSVSQRCTVFMVHKYKGDVLNKGREVSMIVIGSGDNEPVVSSIEIRDAFNGPKIDSSIKRTGSARCQL
jgi:hypothetical protein